MRNADFNGSRHQDKKAAQQRLDQFQTRPDMGVEPPGEPDFGPIQPGAEGKICHLLPKGAKPCLYEPGIVLHGERIGAGGVRSESLGIYLDPEVFSKFAIDFFLGKPTIFENVRFNQLGIIGVCDQC